MRKLLQLCFIFSATSACMHRDINTRANAPALDSTELIASDLKRAFHLYAEDSAKSKDPQDPTLKTISDNLAQADTKEVQDVLDDEELRRILEELAAEESKESGQSREGKPSGMPREAIAGVTLLFAGIFIMSSAFVAAMMVKEKFPEAYLKPESKELAALVKRRLAFFIEASRKNPPVATMIDDKSKREYIAEPEMQRIREKYKDKYPDIFKDLKVEGGRYYLDANHIDAVVDQARKLPAPLSGKKLGFQGADIALGSHIEVRKSSAEVASTRSKIRGVGFFGLVVSAIGGTLYMRFSEDSENNPSLGLAGNAKTTSGKKTPAEKLLFTRLDALANRLVNHIWIQEPKAAR